MNLAHYVDKSPLQMLWSSNGSVQNLFSQDPRGHLLSVWKRMILRP